MEKYAYRLSIKYVLREEKSDNKKTNEISDASLLIKTLFLSFVVEYYGYSEHPWGEKMSRSSYYTSHFRYLSAIALRLADINRDANLFA